MKNLYSIVFAVLASMSILTPAVADEHKGEIKNTVGLITEPVLRERLKNLGYSEIKIDKSNTLRYRIEAVKDNKRVVMYLHPQTGQTVEVGPDEKPRQAWHMPIEPQETQPGRVNPDR